MDEVHFTALFGEGGNSTVFLKGGGVLVAGAIGAKEAEEAGGEGRACSGQ